jgi:class 3 adenylate cyclase
VRAVPTRRYRIRRAIERGDPRLGLIVGVVLASLSAWAFVRRDIVGVADTLELKALDFAFQRRSPIRESDKIVLVDIDDRTLRNLQWPFKREEYGKAILALDRLGAEQIVFDIEFKTVIPRQDEFNEETGDFILSPGDPLLRFAIGKSGKVTLAYHFDLKEPLPERLGPWLPKLKEAFLANVGADLDEVVRISGAPRELLKGGLETIRETLVPALIAEVLDRRPVTTFGELRQIFLPAYDPHLHGADLKLVQYGWQQWRAGRAMELKAPVATVEALPPRARRAFAVVPPMYPFLEYARGVAYANADADLQDGMMRRPWTHLIFQGKSYPYLGLHAGAQALAGPGETAETLVHPDRVDIVVRSGTTEARRVAIPVDGEGRLLVNWAGNARKNRGTDPSYFAHIPFLKFIEFFNTRYVLLDENVRRTIRQLDDDERAVVKAEEYLKLSDRLGAALQGNGDLSFERARHIEDRMDAIRKTMLTEFRAYLAEIEKGISALKSPRARQDAEVKREKWRRLLSEIEAPYEAEAKLRPLVEGRLCLIGSASTGSGDLHSTPLGGSTPGMDVLANVANMALTGQVLRRAPGWVNFMYLFVLGLVIAYYVTHWNTTWSAAATSSTIAASAGLFWFLFTGPGILLSGAGPVVTAVLTFAGVTAYKELLTQRSKRKLQRELEKNTSAELVKILLEHPEFLSEPRKMTGTFFFSDVKSFTSISEKMHADVLFPFINRYLDRMTQALKAHEAFVDKYIGDGIMALFGIPVPTPDHARNACRAALDCQTVLKPLNAEFKLQGLPEIKVRIGIHSGEVSAGNVGALNRSNYTVLGDNVNLAARLEGANKEYETSIMISEATWDLVSGRFVARELDRIRVVGKQKPVRIFELIAVAGQPLSVEPAFLEAYAAALALFKDRLWAESIGAFQKALELKPGDKPCQTYIERAKVFELMPPPPDWEGVFEMTSK